MKFTRLSMRADVKRFLLEKILDGTYKPGQRLVELQIARDLDVSQGPVREALRDLEGLGVVESQHYRGTRVRFISEGELKEATQIRAVLEELAAQLAAPKLKGNVKVIEKEYSSMISAAKSGSWKKYYDHALIFHRSIIEATENQMLLSIWHSVALENRYKLAIYRRTQKELAQTASEHGPILKALERGDGQTAGRLLRKLIESFSFAHIEAHAEST